MCCVRRPENVRGRVNKTIPTDFLQTDKADFSHVSVSHNLNTFKHFISFGLFIDKISDINMASDSQGCFSS